MFPAKHLFVMAEIAKALAGNIALRGFSVVSDVIASILYVVFFDNVEIIPVASSRGVILPSIKLSIFEILAINLNFLVSGIIFNAFDIRDLSDIIRR